MEILDDNKQNWLVMTPEGGTATKTKSSSLNQLLYGHNLFGLIDRGDEIWVNTGLEDEQKVTISPGDDECYTIRPDEAPDLTLGAHYKKQLIDALASVYEDHDGNSVSPIMDLYDSIRDDMIRTEVLEPFAEVFSDKVAVREDGWFIHDHLLLTFEGDFYHPNTNSRERDGQTVIGATSSSSAYSVNVDEAKDEMSRSITVDGQDFRLTNKEVGFIARVIWAIENTPDQR